MERSTRFVIYIPPSWNSAIQLVLVSAVFWSAFGDTGAPAGTVSDEQGEKDNIYSGEGIVA